MNKRPDFEVFNDRSPCTFLRWVYEFPPECKELVLLPEALGGAAEMFSHVLALKGLEKLWLTRWTVTPEIAETIAGLTELRELRLECCALEPAVLVKLRPLHELRILDLSREEAQFGRRGRGSGAALQRLLPHLRMFAQLHTLICEEELLDGQLLAALRIGTPGLRCLDVRSDPPRRYDARVLNEWWEAFGKLERIVLGHSSTVERPKDRPRLA